MNSDPFDVALRHVVETRDLLENLITSSESFDYPTAKQALVRLQQKVRELAKLQAEMSDGPGDQHFNVSVVEFREQEFWPEA